MKGRTIDNNAGKTGVNHDCCRQTRTHESPWREGLGEEISFHLKIEKWPEAGQTEIRQGSDRSNTISKLTDMIFKIWMVF